MRRIATGTTLISRSAALAACLVLMLASFTPAVAQGGKYHEAPALAEQVKAAKLPPVEQRLPEQPLVVPVVEKIGEYGGVWRRAFLGPADANNYVRVVYDGLFRFTPDGAEIEPKIAAGAKSSADFKVWTILLRRGARWSDGAPFTADDIVFWYKDVLLNKDLMPSVPSWIRNTDGTAAKVEKVDDTTVRFTYDRPATLFLTEVANQDGADGSYAMFLPAHYLKKFHPAYTAKEEVDRLAQSDELQDLDRAVPVTRHAVPEPGASDDGGVDAGEPGERSGVHAAAQSVLHRRRFGREPASLYRRGPLHLLRRSAGAEPGRDCRQLRHAGAAHPDDQLSGAEGAGEEREVSRA